MNGVENCSADNVTGAVRNDRCLPEHKFQVLFATGQCWHALLELTPGLNQLLSQIDFIAFHWVVR